MALSLKTPAAARGALWVREGFRLFGRKPLAFSGLFAAFLFASLLVALLPVIGWVLQAMMLPLLSLGFMVASAGALKGDSVHPGQFFEPFQAAPTAQKRALLVLCALYGAATLVLALVADGVAGGKLGTLLELMMAGPERAEERDALAADPDVFLGSLIFTLGVPALSVPFWHAPALVHWGAQGVGQALFSSTLAVWRAKGAFVVYLLAWMALMLVFVTVAAVLLQLLGGGGLAGLVAIPAVLLFSTVFYVSLVFCFSDSFGRTPVEDLPPA
jgi:hypothetical protein